MSRNVFLGKSFKIQSAYRKYLAEVVDGEQDKGDLLFRFSTIMGLVQDLHYGKLEDQTTAIELLSKLNLRKVGETLLIPEKALKDLIYSPDLYADNIEYLEDSYDISSII